MGAGVMHRLGYEEDVVVMRDTREFASAEQLTDRALDGLCAAVGKDWVDTTSETLAAYGVNTLPTGERRPSAVVRPGGTEEVQELVRVANQHRLHLYSISTGSNHGLGGRCAVRPGAVIVDLGARMNRILEVDEELAYAVVEPGVTYAMLYQELGRRGHKLQLDPTTGPPEGGVVGNTLDKGAGYSPYFDHPGMSCGYEVVLADGRVLRTSDGAIRGGGRMWHLGKYSFGPQLEGLFLQSNFGIVTRMGVWLMPRPPGMRAFFFEFPDDEDLAFIVEAVRPLRLTGVVPSLVTVTSDMYAIGTIRHRPRERVPGGNALTPAVRAQLRGETGIGAWTVSGALYGPPQATEATLSRVRMALTASGKATEVSHEAALERPELAYHVDVLDGRPTRQELEMVNWRPNGGNVWFCPAAPQIGKAVDEQQQVARRVLTDHGFEYMAEYVCGGRAARALHSLVFDRTDQDECARAHTCCRALIREFAALGYAPGRMPVDTQAEGLTYFEVFPQVCAAIKEALDPNNVLSPGRYGIG
jgi:4-cresol dehydrogenase (hydroxylating)